MLGDHARKGSWMTGWTSFLSSLPSPSQNGESSSDSTTVVKTEAEPGGMEWLKSLPTTSSLYFSYYAVLASISKKANMKLYSGEAMQSPWASLEFTIRSLTLDIDGWIESLPQTLDFRVSSDNDSSESKKTMHLKNCLAFAYYSTKIAIGRPCLCRLEKDFQTESVYDFCTKTAAECVDAATQLINVLPSTMEASTLYNISPWWCTLHYIMKATAVLLLELSFRAEHVPERAGNVSQALKKAVKWLFELSHSSDSAHRAWKLSDQYFRSLAPPLNLDTKDLPEKGNPIDSSEQQTLFSAMDESLLDHQLPSLMPCLEPESFDFLDTQDIVSDSQAPLPSNNFDDLLPYDPNTGQLTGSFFPSMSTSNIDMELDYMLDSSAF